MASKKTLIGELDRIVTIQNFTDTKEDDGSVTEGWATFKSVWAKREYFNTPTMKNEKSEAESITATSKVQFTIRYLDGLSKTMRILDSSEIFLITAINIEGRREWIKIEAESKE
jgi:head-tail adaptor